MNAKTSLVNAKLSLQQSVNLSSLEWDSLGESSTAEWLVEGWELEVFPSPPVLSLPLLPHTCKLYKDGYHSVSHHISCSVASFLSLFEDLAILSYHLN